MNLNVFKLKRFLILNLYWIKLVFTKSVQKRCLVFSWVVIYVFSWNFFSYPNFWTKLPQLNGKNEKKSIFSRKFSKKSWLRMRKWYNSPVTTTKQTKLGKLERGIPSRGISYARTEPRFRCESNTVWVEREPIFEY